jgi:hypothetical protein
MDAESIAFQFAGTGAITAVRHVDTLPGTLMATEDVQQACEDAIVAQEVFRGGGESPVTFTFDSENTPTSGVTITVE